MKIRIGTGAGFSGDRIGPAVELAERGELNYLVFETLAERTIALASLRRLKEPERGYDPHLEERLRAVLPACAENGTRIITSMGAANPIAGAKKAKEIVREFGLELKVAAVTGDNVLPQLENIDWQPSGSGGEVVSASAYLGSEGIVRALEMDADIIITGRVCDASLFLAPMIHEFGWNTGDLNALAFGTAVGHLMECGAQVTGGYFAWNEGDVTGIEDIGFPIAEVFEHEKGEWCADITKLPDTGGRVDSLTVKSQLLYEVSDPGHYATADVVADYTAVRISEKGKDRVRVCGGRGEAPPERLKVSIGVLEGFIGEGEISYGGFHALERARMAVRVLEHRLNSIAGCEDRELSIIGLNSLFSFDKEKMENKECERDEYRVRLAIRGRERAAVGRGLQELEALYLNGPAGGGGVRTHIESMLRIRDGFIPRERVSSEVVIP